MSGAGGRWKPQETSPAERLGRSAGGYRLLVELARGGMGVTYLARGAPDAQPQLAVLKRPHAHLLLHPEVRQRFYHEAAIASFVHHPYLLETFGFGEDPDGPYLLLEYVHGTPLEDLIDRAVLRGRRLDPRAVALIGVRCLAALEALHGARDPEGEPLHIVHRDVSPQNVLISASGEVRLGDFGIAKSRLQHGLTDERDLLGKLPYLPIEYLKERRVGPLLDVYSLAVTLWTAFAGRSPFTARDERNLVLEVLRSGVPPLSTAWPECPAELDALLQAATHKDWKQRLSPAELRKGLTRCLLRNVPEGLLAEIVDELAGADLRRRASAWQIEMDLGREGVKSSGVFRSSASQAPEPLPAVAVHRSRRG